MYSRGSQKKGRNALAGAVLRGYDEVRRGEMGVQSMTPRWTFAIMCGCRRHFGRKTNVYADLGRKGGIVPVEFCIICPGVWLFFCQG